MLWNPQKAQKQSVADDEIFTIRKADRKRAETTTQIDKVRAELKKVEDEKQREYEKAAMQINELKHEIEQVKILNTIFWSKLTFRRINTAKKYAKISSTIQWLEWVNNRRPQWKIKIT